MKPIVVLAIAISLSASTAFANRPNGAAIRTSTWSDGVSLDRLDPQTGSSSLRGSHASAAVTTLTLGSYTFNSGATCITQGWTSVDLTAPVALYWHVDDFSPSNGLGDITAPWHTGKSTGGITFNRIQNTKSIWMGKRVPPAGSVDTIHCSYLSLPGYGNGWNQSFCSKVCLPISGGATTQLDVSFKIKFDTEAGYDATTLEYTGDCTGNTGWTEIDGGVGVWDGADSLTVAGSYAVGPGPVKLRLHFTSDAFSSNQDGLYKGFGVAVDALQAEYLAVEDFESEAIGSTSSNDWEACDIYGRGNFMALFKKTTGANYEDQCLDNLSCYWAAIQGSTEFYTCGAPSQPTQAVVPHKNTRGQYVWNEIWSPAIPLSGAGSEFRLRYTVYRDLPLDNLVFHTWRVRTIGGSGCPGPWKDSGALYYGDSKDWAIVEHAIGSMVDATSGASVQLAIGVIDMCRQWCGIYGSGSCHSPAPYFDQVKLLRIASVGPQWDVRALDTFQDTFATNGTLTGTARIDTANDISPAASPTILPGDSAVVLSLVDPTYIGGTGTNASGLLADPVVSGYPGPHQTKRQAYMFVTVRPIQPAKTGAPVSEGPGGQANRYPFMGTVVVNGATWTKIRMDYTYEPPSCGQCDGLVSNRFNVDLNDNLFTPGDTLLYFYGATSADGTTYYSTEYGAAADVSAVAANAMEVTILPAGGYNRGGDMLYVDGADGLGVQSYMDGAAAVLGIAHLIDRYDVRDPGTAAGNRPAGRVNNVAAQLNAAYEIILWDTGSLTVTLGDGTGNPLKTDDYAMLNAFFANLGTAGGVYLLGDDVAQTLNAATGSSAIAFRTARMPFTLINANHRLAPTMFSISPSIKAWPGRAFVDNFNVFGGCPMLNDFDVIGASGGSLVQMSYNTASNANGAVVSHKVGPAGVLLSGFSFSYIRDDELDGVSDRAKHLHDALYFLGNWIQVGAGDLPAASSLSQNYPNPFNPATTIEFSLASKGRVRLAVYDVGGRLVRTLENGTRDAGPHESTWDGRDSNGNPAASGVYFYRLVAPGVTQTRKMVLLK